MSIVPALAPADVFSMAAATGAKLMVAIACLAAENPLLRYPVIVLLVTGFVSRARRAAVAALLYIVVPAAVPAPPGVFVAVKTVLIELMAVVSAAKSVSAVLMSVTVICFADGFHCAPSAAPPCTFTLTLLKSVPAVLAVRINAGAMSVSLPKTIPVTGATAVPTAWNTASALPPMPSIKVARAPAVVAAPYVRARTLVSGSYVAPVAPVFVRVTFTPSISGPAVVAVIASVSPPAFSWSVVRGANLSVATALASPEALWMLACVAAWVISTFTPSWPLEPMVAWLIFRSWIVGIVAELVTKSRLPSNRPRPWNLVVWATRLMACQRGVDLQLVGRDLVGAHGAGVGRLFDQPADVVQQRADLAQGAVGRGDHLVGLLAVADRLLRADDVAAKHFAGDQTGRDRPCPR